MKKILKQKKGITLIALVITIIVLLILAGISIAMLSGDNGILQKATDGKTNSEIKGIIEQARIDVLGQQAENKGTNITKEQLIAILNKYFETVEDTDIPDEVSSEQGQDYELTTKDDKYTIMLSEIFKGKFANKENDSLDWNAIFVSAVQNPENYKHPDQIKDTRIAFGPSGNPVNLDLWNVENGDDGYIIKGNTYFDMMGPHSNPGYLGTIDEEGKIQGEMPMYIQSTTNADEFIPVTSLESTFSYMPLKYDPVIPNTVKIIGANTFYGCILENIIIPNGVTTIESTAFAYHVPIKNMIIPSSVTKLSADSLPDNLDSVTVESGNTVYDSRENCNAIIETNTNTLVYGSGSAIIPSTVTGIGQEAFAGRSNLRGSITIPGNVKSIGENAFRSCFGLGDVNILSGVESVGNYAFKDCLASEIHISNTVTSVGSQAFSIQNLDATIFVPFKEGEKPSGWSSTWSEYGQATIVYLN